MGLFSARREAEQHWEQAQAAQAAEAAERGEVVPIAVPLSVQACQVSDHRKSLKTFACEPEASGETATDDSGPNYPARFNPFGDFLPPSASQPPPQQVIPAESFVDVCPENFSVAAAGIRSKLDEVFEPREPLRELPQEPHQDEKKQPVEQVVIQAEVHTASIQRRPSHKKRRAPPPPTLPKPQPEVVAARRATASAEGKPSRRAPSPPRRSSSLRSLNNMRSNSLRRSNNVPLRAES